MLLLPIVAQSDERRMAYRKIVNAYAGRKAYGCQSEFSSI
jgi:hypothetical protein